MQITIYTGLIEYDSGTDPSLYLHTDENYLRLLVAEELYSNTAPDPSFDHGHDQVDDLPAFYEQYPHSPVIKVAGHLSPAGEVEIAEWLIAFREATTVPWVTFGSQVVEVQS